MLTPLFRSPDCGFELIAPRPCVIASAEGSRSTSAKCQSSVSQVGLAEPSPTMSVKRRSPGMLIGWPKPRCHVGVNQYRQWRGRQCRTAALPLMGQMGHNGYMATMTVAQAKNHFSDVLRRAEYGGERVVVERHGKPVAAIVSTD